MTRTNTEPHDFAVLHPDGRVEWGHRTPPGAELLNDAIRRYIPDLGTQGMGRGSGLRMWFSDTFTADMPPNPLADELIGRLGYKHRDGWRGIVAVSAEEPEWEGPVPSLPPEVRRIIEERGQASS